MLQPWRCDRCSASGLLECWSNEDVLQLARAIALMHAVASPHCDEDARHVRVGNWRRAGVIE